MVKIGSRNIVKILDYLEKGIMLESTLEEIDSLIVNRKIKLEKLLKQLPEEVKALADMGLFNIHNLTLEELEENEYIKRFGNGYEHPKAGEKKYGYRKLRAGYLAFLTDTNFHIDNYSFVRNLYYHGPEIEEKQVPGKISPPFKVPALMVDGSPIYPMEVTPDEIISFNNRSENASGNVLICGCGVGFTAYTLSLREDIDSITILENDPDVIALFKENIEPEIKTPIRIIECDALEYLGLTPNSKGQPQEDLRKYNYIDVDTWFSLEDMIYPYLKCLKLEKEYPDITFSYWLESGFYNKVVKEIFSCLIKLRESEATFQKYTGDNPTFTMIAKYILNKSDTEIMNKEDLDKIISFENVRALLLEFTVDNPDLLEIIGIGTKTSRALATKIATDKNSIEKNSEILLMAKLAKLARKTGNQAPLFDFLKESNLNPLKAPLQKK